MNTIPPPALRSTATRPAAVITSNRPQGGQASSQARTAGILPAVARFTTQARPGSPKSTLPGLTAAICLTLTALLHHTSHAEAINPDPGSGQVSAISITRGVPAGHSYDPLVPLPGGEVYEIPPDRTGRISLTLGISHNFQGTITTSIRDSDGARIAAATGDHPTFTFDPLKFRYPFILTVESPTAAPSRTILIAPRNIGNAIGPGFTGSRSSHDPNPEGDDEYRIDQGNDSGSYDIEGKDISSGACGACRSSSCDLSHANETANADATGPTGRFLAGFSAGISMQGDSFTGVDVEINPAAGVSRASFKSHGTGDATIARVDDLDDGNLLAITTGSAHTTFADIANGVRISIAKDPASTAFRTITFVNTATNQVTRTSTYGDKSIETTWSYNATEDPTWTVITGNGARKSKLILEENTATLRVQRRELYERAHGATGIAGVLVSEVLETYQKTLLGWRKTKSEIIGDSGPSPTTTWEYFGPAEGLTKAGLPASITRPDGATETHNYFISGGTYTYHTISRPFPDGTNPLIETRAKTTTGSMSYTYFKVGANFLSLGYDTWSGTTMTRHHHDGTAYRSTTHTVNAFGTDFGGIPTSVAMPDGTRVTQAHSRGSQNNQVLWRNLTVDAGVRVGAVIGEGTTTVTIRDHNGILSAKSVAAIGTGAGTVLNDFKVIAPGDALGRPTTFHYFPDAQDTPAYIITRDYACCGLLSETDKHGLTTTYQYDDLGRSTHVNRQSVTLATVYDGFTVSTHRYPENPAVDPSGTPPLSHTTRNLAGTSITTGSPDPSALDGQGDGIPGALITTTTTVSYSSAGTTTETNISGSGAQTTHTHPGGRTWKTTGNLSPRRIHAYAVNPTGLVTASAYLISDGATPTIAEPTATQFDRAGRIVATGILPDLAPATLLAANNTSGGTLSHATRFSYNELGQLAKTTDADNVTTLHAYNPLGERTTTAIKLDNESTITYGTDQITRTKTFPHEGNIRTTTEVWQDGAQPTLVSQTDRSPDGLASSSWQIGRGATPNDPTATFTHTETDLQGNGAWTTTTTHPDGTKTKEIHTNGRLARVEQRTSGNPGTVIAYTEYGYEEEDNNGVPGIPGRLRTTTDSRTGTTTTIYISNTADFVKSLTEPGTPVRTTSFTYDPRGNRLATKHPDNSESRARYDTYGRLTATWASLTYASVRSYDYAGRLLILRTSPDSDDNDPTDPSDDFPIDSGGTVTFWQYSPATGLLTGKFHDHEGPDNDDGPTYDHTPAGRLETRTWKRNILTTYHYDPAGDLRAIDYGDGTPDILYTRDRLGRVTTAAQGTLNAAVTALDTTLRSTTYDYNDTKLTLDTEATDLGGGFQKTLTRHYDEYARPRSLAIGTEYTAAYAYDTAGRLGQVWHQPVLDDPQQPTGGITFTYGYLSDTTAGHGSLLHTLTKAAVGNDPALVATRNWEPTRDVLEKIENTAGQTVRSSYDYSQVNGGVNSIGQRMGVQTTFNLGISPPNSPKPGNTSYGYDSLGQLTSADHNTVDSLDRAYQYDDIGNRVFSEISSTQISDPPVAGTTSYFGNTGATQPGANALNQYAAVKVGTAAPLLPQHDVDGNLVEDAAHNHNDRDREYVWDAENRLIAVNEVTARANGAITSTTRLVTHEYDHLSRLITRTTDDDGIICYLYDGWNRIAEYNFTPADPPAEEIITLSRTNTWGLDLSGTMQGAGGVGGLLAVRQGGVSYYPTYDGNGNISEYLDADGIAVAHFEYDPFGNLVVDSFNNAADFPYRFSTKPQDMVSGWYYYGYRWYDPVMGRWPSRDPIGEKGGRNLYGFVKNDGVSNADNLGLYSAGNIPGTSSGIPNCPDPCESISHNTLEIFGGGPQVDHRGFYFGFGIEKKNDCYHYRISSVSIDPSTVPYDPERTDAYRSGRKLNYDARQIIMTPSEVGSLRGEFRVVVETEKNRRWRWDGWKHHLTYRVRFDINKDGGQYWPETIQDVDIHNRPDPNPNGHLVRMPQPN